MNDDFASTPYTEPVPMTREQYEREAIASAQSTMPDDQADDLG